MNRPTRYPRALSREDLRTLSIEQGGRPFCDYTLEDDCTEYAKWEYGETLHGDTPLLCTSCCKRCAALEAKELECVGS